LISSAGKKPGIREQLAAGRNQPQEMNQFLPTKVPFTYNPNSQIAGRQNFTQEQLGIAFDLFSQFVDKPMEEDWEDQFGAGT
jgi:hypothetical protein